MVRINVDFSDLKKQIDAFNFDELIEASRVHRKKRIIIDKVVDSCGECDYVQCGGYANFCEHPDLIKNEENHNGKILAYYRAIPKWCPLEDAKAEIEEDED